MTDRKRKVHKESENEIKILKDTKANNKTTKTIMKEEKIMYKMKKMVSMLLAGAVAVNLFAFPVYAEEEKETESIKIGASLSTLTNAFFVAMKMGLEDTAEEKGIELIVTNADNDVSKQASQIEDLISQEVNALIVNPIDSDAIVPSEQKAAAAGIPVIYCDRGSTGEDYTSFLASDNVAMGAIAADKIADFLTEKYGEPKGKVVEIQGKIGTSAATDRGAGFNDAIAEKYPDIEVIAQQPGDFDQEVSMNAMQNIIQANPEFDAVYGHNDDCILGAMKAIESADMLKNAGEEGHIYIIGIDGTFDAIKAIQDGKIDVTISQDPIGMGTKAIELCVDALGGTEIEKNMIQDSYVIDAENAEDPTNWGNAAKI